ncbi:MAG: site-specific integrase [Rhodospirillales bacterium]|nr:site-specific integrase [Rhodospirillales bacterium]
MAERLSDVFARKCLPPSRGLLIHWDTEVKGFGLRLTPGGSKSFVVDYRAEGRQRRMTIGAYPDWTVAAAREAAKAMKREVDQGMDPMGDRQALRTAPSLQDLWDRYQLEFLPQKSPRSQVDERIMWSKIILPRFARTKLISITTDEIDALHRDVTAIRGTPVRANRTIEVLRRAFNLAIRWKWISANPAVGVRRNPEEKRHRYLNKIEIAALVAALNAHSEPMSANAIKLLMLTGARRGEVLGATWAMFDLDEGVWVKPSAHTKQRKMHRVPLSAPAIRLLQAIKRSAMQQATDTCMTVSPFVFPNAKGGSLVEIKRSWVAVCRKAGLCEQVEKRGRDGKPMKDKAGKILMVWRPTVRMHDLRHSFASILVSAGASLPLIGQLLGHTQPQTTARYAHLYDETMRNAAEAVATIVSPDGPVTPAKKLG